MDDYDQTSGSLARNSEASVVTINKYADEGVLQYRRASNGTRLFKRGQEDVVRQEMARRLSKRGNRR